MSVITGGGGWSFKQSHVGQVRWAAIDPERYGNFIMFAMPVVSLAAHFLLQRYSVADDASIRDGLMHEFAGLRNIGSVRDLRGQDAMRGQAFSCALFSCMAIGGLIMGCPSTAVSHHMASAQACLPKFSGLSDGCAVSALILYAMSNVFLPLPGTEEEYRKSLEEAQAIFGSLPEKDPLVSAVLAFQTVVDGLPLVQLVDTESSVSSPVNDFTCGRNTGTSYMRVSTPDGEATFKRAAASRAEPHLLTTPHAPPAYVVTDGG